MEKNQNQADRSKTGPVIRGGGGRGGGLRKNEQEIGKLRYRTIPFSCEQKNPEKNRSSLGPLSALFGFYG